MTQPSHVVLKYLHRRLGVDRQPDTTGDGLLVGGTREVRRIGARAPTRFPGRQLLPLVTLLAAAACFAGAGSISDAGVPCGRNQHAEANVILPDTGINAGTEIQVSFIQHDPDLSGELSEIAIQRVWPSNSIIDPEPDPRVRLLSGSGQVFIDTMGTRYDQPGGGQSPRPTWYVLHWFKQATVRNALYDSFASQSLWLELWRSHASAPGTRVRLTTTEFGVYPALTCL
jgi:hypothetical protein